MTDTAKALSQVAQLMALSAATAPKAKGQDVLEMRILEGRDIETLAGEMDRLAQAKVPGPFARDVKNIRASAAVVLLGFSKTEPAGLNCGACGKKTCAELKTIESELFDGPVCAYRMLDLGIALGSAAKTASMHNADTRIMYSAGLAAKRLGLIKSPIVLAMPLSGTSKSIYFDRQ